MGRGAGAPLLEERPNHTKQFRHYKFNLGPVSISLECGGSRVPQVTVLYLGLGFLFMECGGSPPLSLFHSSTLTLLHSFTLPLLYAPIPPSQSSLLKTYN